MLKVSLLSVCNFLKVELLACYITAHFPADGIHNWWLWLQVCGNSTRQTDVSDLSGCGSQSTPSDVLWKGLLQSLPGWTQQTLKHLPKLQADGTKLPWHQRWVNSKTAVTWGVYSGNDFYLHTLLWFCIHSAMFFYTLGFNIVLHAWLT